MDTDDFKLIEGSKYFDEPWYRKEYPDVVYTRDCPTPAFHYLNYGYKEGKIPSVIFDGRRYGQINRISENPLVHYEKNGRQGYYPALERQFDCRFKLQMGIDLTFGEKILYLQDLYRERNGVPFDLLERRPVTFTQKLYWYRLFYHDDRMTILADKYRAREYLKDLLGQDYTVPLLNVYEDPADIDFDKLPQSFVLKSSWGTAQNLVIKDKSRYNQKKVQEFCRYWLQRRHNNYYFACERAYKDIPPIIVAEQYLENSAGDLPDLKFNCFDGEPQMCFYAAGRGGHENYVLSYFDLNFEPLPIAVSQSGHPFNKVLPGLTKPKHFEQMLEISKKVSAGFPFARVDFLLTDKEFYLGEITFYSRAGNCAYTHDWDLRLGTMFKLPVPNVNQRYA